MGSEHEQPIGHDLEKPRMMDLPSLTRRRFLAATGTLAVAELTGLGRLAIAVAATTEAGRLKIPTVTPAGTAGVGRQQIRGLNGHLYVPSSYRVTEPLPLLVLLHKSGGSSLSWLPPGQAAGSYSAHAEAGRFIILAPNSPGPTWGVGPKSWGDDYVTINRALEMAFTQYAIDRNRLAIGGFSDGASYALSLGLANGDLFGNVIAFSPGFIVRSIGRGRPFLFISHGIGDNVLPIATHSRPFVASLRKNGYSVDFREFSGGHSVPPAISEQAMTWLTAAFHRRR
jgi:phospholipase/carboxylesterase